MLDSCSGLQKLPVFSSCGAGTGSGLGCLLLACLLCDYGKIYSLKLAVYPLPRISTSVGEEYSSVLATYALLGHFDGVVMLDNEAIRDIFRR